MDRYREAIDLADSGNKDGMEQAKERTAAEIVRILQAQDPLFGSSPMHLKLRICHFWCFGSQ